MVDNVRAFYLLPPQLAEFGGGVGSALWPEAAPGVLWGQGIPQGERAPFTVVNKGSLYSQVNATDDESCVWMKVDEGGDDADWARLLSETMGIAHGTASGSDASVDWDFTATMAASVYYASFDVRTVISGATGAAWASTAYFTMTQGTDKSVNGYISVLELELTNACATASAMYPLVINLNDNAGSNAGLAWIAFREYGSRAPPALFWLGTEIHAAVGSSSATAVWTAVAGSYEDNCDYAIRFISGSSHTPYWLLVSSTAPS